MFVKIDVFGVNKKVQKGTKRSSGPKTNLLGQNKREGGRAETKNAGVKKFSSFIWTLVVTKENGPIGPYRALYGRTVSRSHEGPVDHMGPYGRVQKTRDQPP